MRARDHRVSAVPFTIRKGEMRAFPEREREREREREMVKFAWQIRIAAIYAEWKEQNNSALRVESEA